MHGMTSKLPHVIDKWQSLFYEQNENDARQALNYCQIVNDIYEIQKDDFYTEYAFKLNPTICRRYIGTLYICFKFMTTIDIALKDQILVEICRQKVDEIYNEKHKDQFHLSDNPVKNMTAVEICPMVELSY